MGFWDKLKASVAKKPQRMGTELEQSRWRAPPPRRGTPELLEAYKQLPALKLVVDTVSESVAGLQWKVWRRVDKANGLPVKDYSLRSAPFGARHERLKALQRTGEVEEKADHPMLALLSDPNDYFTGAQVWKLVQTHLDLVGESFLVLERGAGDIPVGLWPVPPAWVAQLPDLTLPRAERTYRIVVAGRQQIVPAADVIHLRHLDPADPLSRGVGTAATLGDELDTDEYAARFTKASFFNNMLPAAVVGIEGLNDSNSAGAKRFKEELAREHQGADRAGKLLITNGKTTFARLDTSFTDMGLVDLRKFLLGFCRMAYRVPPETIGDTATSNKATNYAARENLAEQVTVPRGDFLRAGLQKWLMPAFGDGWVLDFESPVPADREHQKTVMALQPSCFEKNEWRMVAGFKPHPELTGFPAMLPGQKEGEPQQAPTPEQGGAAEAAAEAGKGVPSDPPWTRAGHA